MSLKKEIIKEGISVVCEKQQKRPKLLKQNIHLKGNTWLDFYISGNLHFKLPLILMNLNGISLLRVMAWKRQSFLFDLCNKSKLIRAKALKFLYWVINFDLILVFNESLLFHFAFTKSRRNTAYMTSVLVNPMNLWILSAFMMKYVPLVWKKIVVFPRAILRHSTELAVLLATGGLVPLLQEFRSNFQQLT